MAAIGAGSFAFDDVTADSTSIINFDIYSISCAQVQLNASKLIGQCFIPQQGNDPKHTPGLSLFLIMFQTVCFSKPVVWPMSLTFVFLFLSLIIVLLIFIGITFYVVKGQK